MSLIIVNKHNKAQTAKFSLPSTEQILSHNWFYPWNPTVIFAFGFSESISDATTQIVLDGYIARGGINIIVVDWSAYNGVTTADYLLAISNIKVIGGLVGARISSIFARSLILRTHLVG